MLCLSGERVYLSALEREDCRRLWKDTEYDFAHPWEPLMVGLSDEKADEWFEDIQKAQGSTACRLGIFLPDGTPVGDAALQDIDWKNRSCSVGIGIARIENRGRGYGGEALRLLLSYGFDHLGLERITANTLRENAPARRSLERGGFVLEGVEREAVYLGGRRHDRCLYAVLRADWARGKDGDGKGQEEEKTGERHAQSGLV